MDLNQTLSFEVTSGELLFLLRLVKLPGIPGIVESDLDAGVVASLEAMGAQSILKKGWVTISPEKVAKIDPYLHYALTACAHPERMVTLAYEESPQSTNFTHFFGVKEFSVRHSMIEPGIHSFSLQAPPDLGGKTIEALLKTFPENSNSSHRVSPIHEFDLKSLDFKTLEEKIKTTSGGFTSEDQLLLTALAQPQKRLVISIISSFAPQLEHCIFSILTNGKESWCIDADSAAPDQCTIFNLRRDEIGPKVAKAINEPSLLLTNPAAGHSSKGPYHKGS